MSPLGWIVRPVRWEYISRGLGVPQSRINPHVDECDVLIGIVHRRWGTATETYSSGFEEEFERVRQRRQAGEEVDALLFVRELVDGEKAEEGLVEYRERAYSFALLHKYGDVAEFATLLFEELVAELARRVGPAQAIGADNQATLPSGPKAAQALTPGDQAMVARQAEPGSGEQAVRALRKLSAAIAGGEENIEAETVTRAHLAATAALSASVSGTVLDVHEVNSVYTYRDCLRLTAREQVLIGRTMCEHGLLAPGWRALAGEVTVTNIAALVVLAFGHTRAREMGEDRGVAR